MSTKLPNVTKPCKDCPFRKDSNMGWLGAKRMSDILAASSFTCHKNAKLQCAGHMIIKGEENEFVRTAERFGIEFELSGKELVFDTEIDCINHHDAIMAHKPDLIEQREISFTYTNWKGVTRKRRVVPVSIFFGTSKFHDGQQWFLLAFDSEREDAPMRQFAMRDIEGMEA